MSAGVSRQSSSWYFGAIPDLLLGCGGLYFALFAAMAWQGSAFQAAIPLAVLPLVVLLTGVPHYGATVLRVCESAADRRAYSRIAIGASVGTLALLAVGLRSELLGSLILTVYLTWSPWHYSGQNYGVALMFLRRREVAVAPAAKRWLHAYFVLSFALVALSLHAEVPGADYAPIQYQGAVYERLALGVPMGVHGPLFIALFAGCLGSLLAAAVLLRRGGAALRVLVPSAVVAASQALWFAVPAMARSAGWFQSGGPLAADDAVYAFLWVGVAHSVQYLWVTSYFASRSRRADGASVGSGFFALYGGRVLAIGAALWVLPALAFAPGALGDVPFHAGLGALVAAVVNIHHFILDGAIWKLRDGRIARILLRPVAAADVAPVEPGSGRRPWAAAWLRGGAWALGLACVAVYAVAELEYELGARTALDRGDLPRARAAVQRLTLLGRDGPALRINTALLEAAQGDLERALLDAERAVALRETADSRSARAGLYARAGRIDEAVADYRRARELDPDSPRLANNLAWLLALHRRSDRGSVEEAVALARAASSALGDRNVTALDTLAVAYAAAGRFPQAREVGRRALALAREEGDADQIRELVGRQAGYRRGRAYTTGAPITSVSRTSRSQPPRSAP